MFSPGTCLAAFMLFAFVTAAQYANLPMYLAFSATRNSSGYWIVKMDMDHSYGVEWQYSEEFEAALEVDVKTCRMGELFDFTINFRGPDRLVMRGDWPEFKLPAGHDSALERGGETASWQEAARFCQRRRSHLAVVNTEHDLRALVARLDYRNRTYVGIRNHKGVLIDQYGSPVDVDATLKVNSSSADLDVCYVTDHSFMLYPEPCESKVGYFCERRFA